MTSFIWETDGLLVQAQIQSIIDSGIFGATNHLGYPFGFTQWNNPEISYLHALFIWISSQFISITPYGYLLLITFATIFLNSILIFYLSTLLIKNKIFNYLFLFIGALIPYSLYSLDHPHVITTYIYISILILIMKIDNLSFKAIYFFLIILLATNMFQLITIFFIFTILIIVYSLISLLEKQNFDKLQNLFKIYFCILVIFMINFINYFAHSNINGKNGRTAYQSDIFAGKLTDLLLSSPFLNRLLPNLETLQLGVSGEIRQIGFPLLISSFLGIVFVITYPFMKFNDFRFSIMLSLLIITLLTFITGGLGNLQASLFVMAGEVSPMRSWSRLSIFIGLTSLVLVILFLKHYFTLMQINVFMSLLLIMAVLDFSQIERDSKFDSNILSIEESGFINYLKSNLEPCPVLQLPIDTYFIPQSALDQGWRYYWNGMISYVALPEFKWTSAVYVDSPGWKSLTEIPTEINKTYLKSISTNYCAIVFDKNFSQYQIDRKAGLDSTQGLWPGLRVSDEIIPNFQDSRYSVYLTP